MGDAELLTLFREGDNPGYAFELIVRAYGERLYWHIRKMVVSHEDANDILQNCLIKAWNGLPSFREEAKLYTWLYRIATNEVITYVKKHRNYKHLSLDEAGWKLEESLFADPLFHGDAIQLRLQKAIQRLPNKQRLVFNMRYFDEMKYEQISEIVGTSVGALKASYHHAVEKIEQFMKESV